MGMSLFTWLLVVGRFQLRAPTVTERSHVQNRGAGPFPGWTFLALLVAVTFVLGCRRDPAQPELTSTPAAKDASAHVSAVPLESGSRVPAAVPSDALVPWGPESWFPEGALSNAVTFKEELIALGEPALYGSTNTPQYRLLCVRSFEPPIVVRVTRTTTDSFLMTATRGSQHGVGTVVTRQRALSPEESRKLQSQLIAAHLDKMPSRNDTRGPDGEMWLIEEVTVEGYRAVERWSPEVPRSTPTSGLEEFRALGRYFLRLAGGDIVGADAH